MAYNYIKIDENGTQYATNIAPVWGVVSDVADYYDYDTQKWYDKDGVAYTNGITYLPYRINVDTEGNVLDVDAFELPTLAEKKVIAKTVEAQELKAKNACTAFVNFDGTTTPPTIRDSYNVSQVIRVATGQFDVYFEEEMDNINYSVSPGVTGTARTINVWGRYLHKCSLATYNTSNVGENLLFNTVQIFGGKDN